MTTSYITKDTTYIAEVDGPYANDLHDLVTTGGADEKRAMFALNLATNNISARTVNPMTQEQAAYIMNAYVGSTAIRGYSALVHLLENSNYISVTDAMFLRSDFTLVDEVLCTCDACDVPAYPINA
jgi:hypothetical protein